MGARLNCVIKYIQVKSEVMMQSFKWLINEIILSLKNYRLQKKTVWMTLLNQTI
jgi:hypothetical protein